MKPSVLPSATPSLRPVRAPSCSPNCKPTLSPTIGKTVKPSPGKLLSSSPSIDIAASDAVTEEKISSAVVIGVYVLCGLLGLWLMYRIWVCSYHVSIHNQKKKRFQESLESARALLAQQPPRGYHLPGKISTYKKERTSANLSVELSQASTTMNTLQDNSISVCGENSIRAHSPIGAYANTPNQKIGYSNCSSSSSSSSSVVLSSLHSSELSDLDYTIMVPKKSQFYPVQKELLSKQAGDIEEGINQHNISYKITDISDSSSSWNSCN